MVILNFWVYKNQYYSFKMNKDFRFISFKRVWNGTGCFLALISSCSHVNPPAPLPRTHTSPQLVASPSFQLLRFLARKQSCSSTLPLLLPLKLCLVDSVFPSPLSPVLLPWFGPPLPCWTWQ